MTAQPRFLRCALAQSGNFLADCRSAEGVDTKGTAAHCEDPESQSANCDSPHGESSGRKQKPHSQSAQREEPGGDSSHRKDARCDPAKGQKAGREVSDRDDTLCPAVLLPGDPSPDIDMHKGEPKESPAALIFVMPGVGNIVDLLYRGNCLGGVSVFRLRFPIFSVSAYEFVYGYMEEIGKQHQFIHLGSSDAKFPFGHCLAGNAKLCARAVPGRAPAVSLM